MAEIPKRTLNPPVGELPAPPPPATSVLFRRPLERELAAARLHAMPVWKWLAMHAYYNLSLPYRCWQLAMYSAGGRAPAIVLLFHRVAYDWANEWTTHTESFVQAIKWLQDHFALVSLAEVQQRVRLRDSRSPCVAITFDDGYAENCQVALPLLIKERIPCTYFVSTRHVLEGSGFEHDLAMGNRFPTNTVEQLRELAAAGIEIGTHTRNHANLGEITDESELYDEVVAARDDLESALGTRVRWFAFPFGSHQHLNARAFEMAREAGYDGVVSAYGGYNFPGDDPFHLQRVGVDGPLVRVKSWTRMDPLKQLRMPRFEYARTGPEAARSGDAP